jgi:hypothetical protein
MIKQSEIVNIYIILCDERTETIRPVLNSIKLLVKVSNEINKTLLIAKNRLVKQDILIMCYHIKSYLFRNRQRTILRLSYHMFQYHFLIIAEFKEHDALVCHDENDILYFDFNEGILPMRYSTWIFLSKRL